MQNSSNSSDCSNFWLQQFHEFAQQKGYQWCNPALLQPLDHYVELSGEDIRSRLVLVEDFDEQTSCLRADLTLPLCSHAIHQRQRSGHSVNSATHLSTDTSKPVESKLCLATLGPVFRRRAGQVPIEFTQAGLERFGEEDTIGSDVDVILELVQFIRKTDRRPLVLTIGDVSIYSAIVEAHPLPALIRRKLLRDFSNASFLRHFQESDPKWSAPSEGQLRELLEGLQELPEESAISRLTERVTKFNANRVIARRNAEEIAQLLWQKEQFRELKPRIDELIECLDRYMKIRVPAHEAQGALCEFAQQLGLPLSQQIYQLSLRLDKLSKSTELAGVSIQFCGASARQFEYYSGIVFEVCPKDGDNVAGENLPLIRGGRYDQLCERIGGQSITAVGGAIWIERIIEDLN